MSCPDLRRHRPRGSNVETLPGFINAATTEGGIVSDPNFFDQLYRYGVFVGFGLAAVTYVVLMRAEIPARSPLSAPAEP